MSSILFASSISSLRPLLTFPHVCIAVKGYTKEAGVRAIERKLAAVCRAVAVKIVDPKTKESDIPVLIDAEKVVEILGVSLIV